MIKIDPELRERAEKHAARISVKDQIFVTAEMYFNAIETLGELISVIAAHDAHPVGGVSYGLKDDILHAIHAKVQLYDENGDKDNTFQMVRINNAIDKICMEYAQPGWVEGPPKEPGPCVSEAFDRIAYKVWTVDEIKNQNLSFIARHCRVPEYTPLKREPVVEHKEGCPGKEFYKPSKDSDTGWIMLTGQILNSEKESGLDLVDVTHCQWCGVPLPELKK